jgi:ABC-type transporter MlaC component
MTTATMMVIALLKAFGMKVNWNVRGIITTGISMHHRYQDQGSSGSGQHCT